MRVRIAILLLGVLLGLGAKGVQYAYEALAGANQGAAAAQESPRESKAAKLESSENGVRGVSE